MVFLHIPSVAEISEIERRCVAALRNLTIENQDGLFSSRVCIMCDRFVKAEDEARNVLTLDNLHKICKCLKLEKANYMPAFSEAVLKCYGIKDSPDEAWADDMLLSPRSKFIPDDNGYMACRECFESVVRQKPMKPLMPKSGIAKGWIIGHAPPELECLTPAELALVSRTRTVAHVFAFFGGQHQSIRGWHTFYESNLPHTMNVLEAMGDFNLPDKMYAVLSGPFTTAQRARVMEAVQIRRSTTRAAHEWLRENNIGHAGVGPIDVNNLPEMVIIDDKRFEVGSEDANIENIVKLTVMFPDVSLPHETNGGHDNQEQFRDAILRKDFSGFKTRLSCQPTEKRVKDFEGTNLAIAFPLQFPYGYSNLPRPETQNEKRSGASQEKCIQHYLSLSIPNMHKPLFVLVCHNLYAKQHAIQTSILKCKDYLRGESYGEQYSRMTEEEVTGALRISEASNNPNRRENIHNPGIPGHFMRSLHACCESMGHTDEAATKNRTKFFALNMRYGLSALMFTFSPDDELGLRIQIMAANNWTGTPPMNMNADQSQAEFSIRCEKRLNFPGLCALDFENITHIVLKYLIGWDGTTNTGAFGKVEAFGLAVEEQGRKTLHGHVLVYIKGWNRLMEIVLSHDKSTLTYKRAEAELRKYLDVIGSVNLLGSANRTMSKEKLNIFKHDNCIRNPRMGPVDDNEYRKLRHKKGCQVSDGIIARCQKCHNGMTGEQMIQNGLNMVLPIVEGGAERPLYPDRKSRTLDGFIINQQMDFNWRNTPVKEQAERAFLFNANFNVHATKHVTRCFKKRKECSSNLPQPPMKKTRLSYNPAGTGEKPSQTDPVCSVIQAKKAETHTWYDCFGNTKTVTLFGIERERREEDAYMNTNNPTATIAFGCNNNVTAAVTGKGAIYLTNYSSKGTQKDDKGRFDRVAGALARQIRRQHEEASEDDNPFTIGLRRVIVGFIMQTVAAVISGTLAWFMVKNGSRFRFSHEFQSAIPGQIKDLLFNEGTSTFYRKVGGNAKPFANAMHFMYRPLAMETISFYQFYMETRVKRNNEVKDMESFQFTDDHPFKDFECVVYNSVCQEKDKIPLFNWSWLPSTKHLGGPIAVLNETGTSSDSKWMRNPAEKTAEERTKEEEYCLRFLILFVPIRVKEDLFQNGSSADRLVQAMNQGEIWEGGEDIANNIQLIHDSLSSGVVEDGLSVRTTEFVSEEDKESEKKERRKQADYDYDNMDLDLSSWFCIPEMRPFSCGYVLLEKATKVLKTKRFGNAVTASSTGIACKTHEEATASNPRGNDRGDPGERVNVPRSRLTSLALQNLFSGQAVLNEETARLVDCNGSPESIIKFSQLALAHLKVKDETQNPDHEDGEDEDENENEDDGEAELKYLDPEQKTAFIVMAAAFVLSYYEEATSGESDDIDPATIAAAGRNTRNLRKLASLPSHANYIRLFLTGSAGAGKSQSINFAVAYCSRFCARLQVEFTQYSIRLTALSGSAATEINGETVHSALGINCRKNGKKGEDHHSTIWKTTRIVVIDEISMACYSMLEDINEQLQAHTDCRTIAYGKVHIVFSGDFRQLDPVGSQKRLIYEHYDKPLWLPQLTGFIELKGMHRFETEWGKLLMRIHSGDAGEADIDIINSRHVNMDLDSVQEQLDATMKFAVFKNVNRCAINASRFGSHLQKNFVKYQPGVDVVTPRHTIVVLADMINASTKVPLNRIMERHIYNTSCDNEWYSASGEKKDDKNASSGQRQHLLDPCLKLYVNCRMMLTENTDVSLGISKGTCCWFQELVLKENEEVHEIIMDGYKVNAVFASQVKFIKCKFDHSIFKGTFDIFPITKTVQTLAGMPGPGWENLKISCKVKATYFECVLNDSTTGHKLQGKSVDRLMVTFISDVKNWAYVVLSRVKDMANLYLAVPMKKTYSFAVPEKLREMMEDLRQSLAIPNIDESMVLQ